MPQAFEYSFVVGDVSTATGQDAYTAQLATKDSDGWEVVGFSLIGNVAAFSLLKRRV